MCVINKIHPKVKGWERNVVRLALHSKAGCVCYQLNTAKKIKVGRATWLMSGEAAAVQKEHLPQQRQTCAISPHACQMVEWGRQSG